ncbi:MAG: hypothetical protein ACI4O9_03405 [Akkermansia sp.]
MGAFEDLARRVEVQSAKLDELLDLLKIRRGAQAEPVYLTISSLAVKYDESPQTVRNWLKTMIAAGYGIETARNGARGDWHVNARQFHRAFVELFSSPFVRGVGD